jgi:GT2 family glycosyltransferase
MIPVIIVPVLNRYDLLERCLQSIDYSVETLIVIDNGGQSTLHDWPWVIDRRHVKNYHVWSMPTNLGVATSWNLGIKATPLANGWILLNSDAYFLPGQLEVFFNDCKSDSVTLTEAQPGWCCAWVGEDAVAKVGLFCEAFYPAYFEDTDWQERAKRVNIPFWTSDAGVVHDNSSTINSAPELAEKNQRSFASNAALHAMRWQSGLPDAGHWDLTRRRDLGWD